MLKSSNGKDSSYVADISPDKPLFMNKIQAIQKRRLGKTSGNFRSITAKKARVSHIEIFEESPPLKLIDVNEE